MLKSKYSRAKKKINLSTHSRWEINLVLSGIGTNADKCLH